MKIYKTFLKFWTDYSKDMSRKNDEDEIRYLIAQRAAANTWDAAIDSTKYDQPDCDKCRIRRDLCSNECGSDGCLKIYEISC